MEPRHYKKLIDKKGYRIDNAVSVAINAVLNIDDDADDYVSDAITAISEALIVSPEEARSAPKPSDRLIHHVRNAIEAALFREGQTYGVTVCCSDELIGRITVAIAETLHLEDIPICYPWYDMDGIACYYMEDRCDWCKR